jgi:hypothetical protein
VDSTNLPGGHGDIESRRVLVDLLPAVVVRQIEVKATVRPRLADCAHLRTFRAEYGKKARTGLLLHVGSTLEWLAPDVLAAPWWKVL